jgi:hypothetical protein
MFSIIHSVLSRVPPAENTLVNNPDRLPLATELGILQKMELAMEPFPPSKFFHELYT